DGGGGGMDAGCAGSEQCPLEKPVCAMGACTACKAATDDASCKAASGGKLPHCDAMAMKCVQCRAGFASVDCDSKMPVCGADGMCRGCIAHSECAGVAGICNAGICPNE